MATGRTAGCTDDLRSLLTAFQASSGPSRPNAKKLFGTEEAPGPAEMGSALDDVSEPEMHRGEGELQGDLLELDSGRPAVTRCRAPGEISPLRRRQKSLERSLSCWAHEREQ